MQLLSLQPIITPDTQTLVRIPCLSADTNLRLFYEVRPQTDDAGVGNGSVGTTLGGYMSDDLPNRNIVHSAKWDDKIKAWKLMGPVPGIAPHSGDIAAAGNTLAWVHSRNVGYFGSCFSGPRLNLYLGHLHDDGSVAAQDITDTVYDYLKIDAVFVSSGHAALWHRSAAFPLVCRREATSWVQILYVSPTGSLSYSEPITLETNAGFELDEAALLVLPQELIITCRLRGTSGRISFSSPDGIRFEPSPLFESLDPRLVAQPADAGCNACLCAISTNDYRDVPLLIHPAHTQQRSCGEILASTEQGDVQLASFGMDTFGYSDCAVWRNKLHVVFERDNALWHARFSI